MAMRASSLLTDLPASYHIQLLAGSNVRKQPLPHMAPLSNSHSTHMPSLKMGKHRCWLFHVGAN